MEVGDIVVASGLEERGVLVGERCKPRNTLTGDGSSAASDICSLKVEKFVSCAPIRRNWTTIPLFGASEKGEGEAPGRIGAICAVAQWTV